MTKEQKRIILQIFLFIVTFISTTFAGAEWSYGKTLYTVIDGGITFNPHFTWDDFVSGLAFSVPLLLILTVHEFGHYFMAMFHKIKTSLPYYIPIPPLPFLPFSIGTMGAVIRLRDRPNSNLQHFDIGLAGPLAGFIVAIVILFYGFKTLPPPDYIFQFHPDYKAYGLNYADHVYSQEYLEKHKPMIDITIGSNLVFWFFENFVADPSRVPNPHELMHYPILLACYIALFVTCLNLLPIGQLDGGHVVYGLFGFKIHRGIATVFFIALMFYAGIGLSYINPSQPFMSLILGIAGYIAFLFIAFSGLRRPPKDTQMYVLIIFAIQFALAKFIPGIEGYPGWLIFGFILGRFIGVQHPPSEIEAPLDPRRIVLGWITLLIFILCFSPAPIRMQIIIDGQ
ncbi:MAG: site-2 protease family protein [Bacteroidota bacterium]